MIRYFLLLLFLCAGISNAQSLSTIPNDFQNQLYEIEDEYYENGEFNLAFRALDSLLATELAQNNVEARAKVLFLYAILETDKGHYIGAISKATEGLNNLNRNKHALLIADLHHALAAAYDFLGFYPKSIENLLTALRISEAEGDSAGMNSCFNNLANTLMSLNELSDAKRNYLKALRFSEALQDSFGIGAAYVNLGGLYLREENFDSALFYIKKALSWADEIEEPLLQLSSNGALSDYYFDLNRLDSALFYQKISHRISKESGTAYDVANEEISLASIYLMQDRLKESRETSLIALRLGMENDIKDIISRSYKNLYYVDSVNGDFKQSLFHFQQAQIYEDSLRNEDVAKSAVRQQLEFDFEKKEALAALELLRQQRQRNVFILGFLLMSVASGTILVQRNRISKEKDRSENLLLNILPYETAQELKQKGYADSKQIEQVTVLFTDFKGFTQLSEQLAPQDLVQNIHECFSAFDAIMGKHNVEKIKTIGDAYMAAGGLPTPNASHAVDVVRAALDIQGYMTRRWQEKQALGQPFFEIRIGVHTGPVVAGIVGIKKFQYDIWGDTVNTASRMESSGQVGKVNISSFTHSLVKDQFSCTYRGEIEAKGKGKIGMYFVEAE